MPNSNRFIERFVLAVMLLSPGIAHAQIGVINYDTIGASTILTANSAHAGVFIANVCLVPGEENQFRVCTPDDKVKGVVIQRYANMSGRSKAELKDKPNKDWIAMPLNENIYGAKDKASSPILVNNAVLNGQRAEALDDPNLHLKDLIDPKQESVKNQDALDKGQITYQGDWKYAIDSSAIRTTHIVSIEKTTPDQDAAVVKYLNNLDNQSHFQEQLNNCANFANNVVSAAYGKDKKGKNLFHGRGKTEDAFLVTPASDVKGMKQLAKKLATPYEVDVYNQTPTTYKPSSPGTELTGDSNTGMGIGQLTKLIPSPPVMGAGTIFTLLKFARKMGMPLPGYRPYLDLSGKETKEHGTEALAEASFELDQAKKAKDKQKEEDLKLLRQKLQNETFGTKSCWKDKRESFKALLADAMKSGVVDKKYEKEFKMRDQMNKLLRMAPMVHLNPTHAKLISDVMSAPGTTVDTTHMTITKDGVTAGLTRDNIGNYDSRLGFLIMASSLVYQLDSDETILAPDFDADWKTMLTLATKSGIKVDPASEEGVQACAGKVDPNIALSVVTPAAVAIDPSANVNPDSNANCADCMMPKPLSF